MKLNLIHYPWPSCLMAVLILLWQFCLLFPEGLSDPTILETFPAESVPAGLGVLLLLAGCDFWRFRGAIQKSRRQLQQYQSQISELFDSKRQLGTRARTYSDHADKLKMFISERLLEYIEYDEKFLHFKNIASEVRHNGVISYDKAQTALQSAAEQSDDAQDKQRYLEASDGLLYLWDLLDLSTTDNIALHVTNRIYDCEEHYFQNLLNDTAQVSSPYLPTFRMSQALRRAIHPVSDDPDALITESWKCPGRYLDAKFSIQLRSDTEMLGNENHMVLLIENLINNALFYAQQKPHKNRFARVGITLAQQAGSAELRIYNRGPEIDEQEKDKIYQLGFSSRRIREHHGKGLGLYFVDQIVRGFEGSIEFENITNEEDRIIFSIKLASGEMFTHEVEVLILEGRPCCVSADQPESREKRTEWSFTAAISSIEVSRRNRRKPQVIAELSPDQNSEHLDVAHEQIPRWIVEVKNRKRSSKLIFQPLDVRGVEFVTRFPGAKSRLDYQD
ncbi:MAG: ATP-binding protein [Pseudomonadota bacterium]